MVSGLHTKTFLTYYIDDDELAAQRSNVLAVVGIMYADFFRPTEGSVCECRWTFYDACMKAAKVSLSVDQVCNLLARIHQLAKPQASQIMPLNEIERRHELGSCGYRVEAFSVMSERQPTKHAIACNDFLH